MIQPPNTHLAQLNVARAVDDLGSARLADFMAAIDRVNAVAERSPGFVWRLVGDGNDATDVAVTTDARVIVNLSVWETAEDLEHFVWNTVHKRVYAKKAKWFEPPAEPHFVMWWVPAGHRPTPADAMVRLEQLRGEGPSEHAFGWERKPRQHPALDDTTLRLNASAQRVGRVFGACPARGSVSMAHAPAQRSAHRAHRQKFISGSHRHRHLPDPSVVMSCQGTAPSQPLQPAGAVSTDRRLSAGFSDRPCCLRVETFPRTAG